MYSHYIDTHKFLNLSRIILIIITLSLMSYRWIHFQDKLIQNLILTITPLSYWVIILLIYLLSNPKNKSLIFITLFLIILTTISYWLFIFQNKIYHNDSEKYLDILIHILPLLYIYFAICNGYIKLVIRNSDWIYIIIILLFQLIVNYYYKKFFGTDLYHVNRNSNKYTQFVISLIITLLIIFFIKIKLY